MSNVNKIDLAYLKVYINSYQESNIVSETSFIKDMIYGIGLSIDKEKFKNGKGYSKFENKLLDEVIIKRNLIVERNKYDETLALKQ
tara:strand:+ start:295 stop:552 length:258 start_codon:yes stop_codon:yes gene_type:complete